MLAHEVRRDESGIDTVRGDAAASQSRGELAEVKGLDAGLVVVAVGLTTFLFLLFYALYATQFVRGEWAH